jgi:hypothetical protein
MTDIIRWEDPPPSVKGNPWRERLLPLTEYPKRWAIIGIKPTRTTASSLRGNLTDRKFTLPPGRWEFAYRVVNGEHRVYGRYLGPDQDGGDS